MFFNVKLFIVFSLTLSVSSADESGNNESLQNNLDYISHEGNSCDVKLSTALSLLTTEMLQNNRRVDELWKTKHDLEEGIDGKFHKLEKKILDKLEEYIEGKLDSLEKRLYRKIDALEKNIPDKTDIAILYRKFDGLNKMQTNIDENTMRDTKVLTISEAPIKVHEEMESKLLQHIEENINIQLNTIKTQILNITNNKSCNWDLHEILNKIQKNILEQNKNRLDASENTKEKNILPNRTHGYWECKNRTVSKIHDFELFRLDNDTFNYFTVKSDDDGRLTHFEMHFAAKGTLVHIQLSVVPHPGPSEGYLLLQIDGTYSYVLLARRNSDGIGVTHETLKRFDSPTGLRQDRYTAFYIKITNQTLEVGKEVPNTPLIQYNYTDGRFRSVQYIGLTSWAGHESSYLYDCPPHFEETIF